MSIVINSIHLLSPQIEGEGVVCENASGGCLLQRVFSVHSPRMETALSAFRGCAKAVLGGCAGVNEPELRGGEGRGAEGKIPSGPLPPSSNSFRRRRAGGRGVRFAPLFCRPIAEIELGDRSRGRQLSPRPQESRGSGKSGNLIRVATNEDWFNRWGGRSLISLLK